VSFKKAKKVVIKYKSYRVIDLFKDVPVVPYFFHKTPQYWGYEDFFLTYRIYRQNEEEVPYFPTSIFGFSKP